MIRNYLFLCLFGIMTCFLASTVAREAIVGGTRVAHIDVFSYQVSVQLHGFGHVCGGAIISDFYVVTAAQCVIDHNSHFRSPHIYVVAGTNNLSNSDPPAVNIPVLKVFRPAVFDPSVQFTHADIAILGVLYSFRLSHQGLLKKVDLSRIYSHLLKATITGFGWYAYSNGIGHSDSRLRYALVNLYRNGNCEQSYPNGEVQSDLHICGEMQLPRFTELPTYGVCYGDIGSPLVRNGTLFGILSRISHVCDDQEKPAVYTRVARYRRMILNVIENGYAAEMVEMLT